MTTPAPASRPTWTPPLIAALGGLLVLAIATLVVVVTGGDDPPPVTSGPSGTPSSASSSTAAPSTAAPGPGTVWAPDLQVAYSYPLDGYDAADWAGPADVSAGIVDLVAATSYAACSYAAGSDVLFGLLLSDQTDLAQAAKIGAVDMSKSVWSTSGEASTTDPTAATEKTTDAGVVGQLVEIESTRADNEPDECGTTTSHIAAFAFQNADGQVLVLVSSHRTDGDAVKDADALADDVATTFQSVSLL